MAHRCFNARCPAALVLGWTLQLLAAISVCAGEPPISAERIRADVKYLAGDRLEGRGIGTLGEERTTDYIVEQFTKAGLKPAGERGTFFQTVPLVGVTTDPTATRAATKADRAIAFELHEEWAGACRTQKSEDFDAEAIFVGH